LISRVGRQVPAHAGAPAKVLLAERADDELPLGDEPLRALTDNAHTARTTQPAGLTEVRAPGCSADRKETVVGIAGIGFTPRYDAPDIDPEQFLSQILATGTHH
jgi:DNA-binding IclR family transcriptional regulator